MSEFLWFSCSYGKIPSETIFRHSSVPFLYYSLYDQKKESWATSWQNQQNDCAPSEDSDQPGPSLIRIFAVRMKKAWVLSYPLSAQRRPWSDWVDAQADLSLCWVHSHFVGFVMRWLSLKQVQKKRKWFKLNVIRKPCHKKTCLWGQWPGSKTQTGLFSYRD